MKVEINDLHLEVIKDERIFIGMILGPYLCNLDTNPKWKILSLFEESANEG